MSRRRIGLLLLFAFVVLVVAGCSSTNGNSDISVKVGDGQASSGNGQFALSLELLVAMTVLSLVPAILMLATSFTRIIVVLSLLRSAIGIPNLPPNQVLLGLSMFLTFFVMSPVFSEVNNNALQPYLNNTIDQNSAIDRGTGPFKTFMLKQTRSEDLQVFIDLSKEPRPKTANDVTIEVLLPAYVISELKTAFTMGFLLYIPFLIIDLVVASALMSMGMVMVSPTQIALPFKLLLFVMVDGWVLVVQSLVRSFG
ncbi:MAG TPA: flagellar type III secretion system pore protein FliP [Candidatus Limnocylindrales bacterium]